ncbi:RNA methyltransferase [Conexivisphaera calida]|uniref:tRNA:Cm32/Um32 methyltransferase n=1 Tax=Conexivisphaera calida TaxID=1874277 RepID=A0A4P2VBS3_9ARCH|nr:RNA methyltransferase [Conexivisphaera calida]BBE41567.1 tRNA:Cm32/Um32 methyltransferase [Conexivisphaera calida]
MSGPKSGRTANEPYRRWSVVLVDPHYGMNVGYVARVMMNFGLRDLVLVSSRGHSDKLGTKAARQYASHGSVLLDSARVVNSLRSLRSEKGLLVATTAKVVGAPRRLIRRPMSVEELVDLAAGRDDVALVLGRDTTGLTNEEIAECDFVVHVPTWTDYPTLNISHALAIILYEVAKGYHGMHGLYGMSHPSAQELSALDEIVSRTVDILGYEGGRATKVSVLIRRLAERGDRTEVRALMGVLGKFLGHASHGHVASSTGNA